MRLIDADEFFKDFTELESYEHISHEYDIDAVEVVRCKDCKNLGENDGYYFCNAIGIAFGEKPNWFCADGERRDDG